MTAWGAAATTSTSPDLVSAGMVTAVVALLGVVGGAIAWVKVQVDRGEDRREAARAAAATEQRRLDELHRDDRDHWVDRLGVKDMEREYRAALSAVETAHRVQLDEQHADHLAAIDAVERRLDRVMRATELRGLRHRRWDEEVRADIVALGGRDPGDPPPMYETDGELLGEWVEDPPAESTQDLPRRRVDDPAGP